MTKKGIDSVSADFGLITIAYNVKRMIHVFEAEELIKRLKNTLHNIMRHIISRFFAVETLSKQVLRDVYKGSVFYR